MRIWRVPLGLVSAQLERERLLLDAGERERAQRLRFVRDQTRFIAAHAALRHILGAALNTAPQAVTFTVQDHGRPELSAAMGASGLRFSLSHSGDWALVALSASAAIGVDLEVRVPGQMAPTEILSALHPQEVAAIAALAPSESSLALYRCWVRKEALLKAIGTGIGDRLSSFCVSVGPTAALHSSTHEGLRLGQWSLAALDLDGLYAAAVAVEAPAMPAFTSHEWVWRDS